MKDSKKHNMSASHFRDKGIDWWTYDGRIGVSPHDELIFSSLTGGGVKEVLEIGPGRGAFTFRMRDVGCHVVALEVNPGFIDFCRKKGDCTGIDFVEGDAETLPFREGRFDAVVCVEVLMHLPDPAKTFQEISKVVRPNGCVLVTYLRKHTKKHLKFTVSVTTGIYERKHGRGSVDYRYDSLRDIKRYLDGTGLNVEKVSNAKSTNPCILIRKRG